MKLQAERTEGTNAIARHGMAGVVVGNVEYRSSVLVPWQGPVVAWPVERVEQLTHDHFAPLLAMKPELVVFGSGQTMRFAPTAAIAALLRARIGVESMDTAAACRTYNVLLAEGRSVVAALLFLPTGFEPTNFEPTEHFHRT